MMDDVGVDWSQLPMELLEVVSSQLLPSETDLIRFRSVCSTWRRSSVSSPKSINSFPILPNQVDTTGRAVLVELESTLTSTPTVTPVAQSLHGSGDKKYLVESYGDLLLVDMYLSAGPEDDFGYIEGFQFYEDFDCYMTERTVKFRVFRLDKDMHCWESMPSLGDLIVFLGDNCSFSAPASQINSTCKGNCIFFTDHFYSCKEEEQEDGVWKSRGIGVFDLGTGRIGPISDYPGYSTMFWPPPHWVYSTATIEEVLEQLSI